MPTRFEEGLGYLVHHLMYGFRQLLSEQCEQSGYPITADELAVLMITDQNQGRCGLKQTDIAAALARDKAVITRLVTSLVDKQLLLRRADPADRRAYRVRLSAQGREAVADLKPQLAALLRTIYRDIDRHEYEQARDLLQRVLANLQALKGVDNGS